MDWSYTLVLILIQFVDLSVGKRRNPEKCENNFEIHPNMHINEQYIEQIGRKDGISSILQCQEWIF